MLAMIDSMSYQTDTSDDHRMNSDEHVLAEGGYLSEVVEPASGESLIGLAWLRVARSATDRKQLFFILYI